MPTIAQCRYATSVYWFLNSGICVTINWVINHTSWVQRYTESDVQRVPISMLSQKRVGCRKRDRLTYKHINIGIRDVSAICYGRHNSWTRKSDNSDQLRVRPVEVNQNTKPQKSRTVGWSNGPCRHVLRPRRRLEIACTKVAFWNCESRYTKVQHSPRLPVLC